jgi:tetratricopeptide (TPR) repeat protein
MMMAHSRNDTIRQWRRTLVGTLVALFSLLSSFPSCPLLAAQDPATSDATPADPLATLGFSVTTGAAPGYVDDKACAVCHQSVSASYQEVGMARSFFRPGADNVMEDFSQPAFFHAPSQQYLVMQRRGERLSFKRYQLDADGKPINVFEQPVDWVLGSGHTSRIYLYQTGSGELYQLPLVWYSQTKRWGMAPGFDRPRHDGVLRRVRRECLFCHNAYPNVPARSDTFEGAHTFPTDLPQGVGCQRCHGPGAEHARQAFRGALPIEQLRATIINPKRLEPRLRDDVCLQCHLQPSVALPGLRRFERGDYSFRPGQPLDEYLVQLDVQEEGKQRADRFEINHHGYRLQQSRCFQEAKGKLGCITCHDPHRKVPAAERAAHYRAACLGCHVKAHTTTDAIASDDCVSCHTPRHRTQDVVHVVMTDHLIRRQPGGPELLAPLTESEPTLTQVELLDTPHAPTGTQAEIYRTAAVVQASGAPNAIDRLQKLLAPDRPMEVVPLLILAERQLTSRRFADAERTLTRILDAHPARPLAQEWLGIAQMGVGKSKEAIEQSRQALRRTPERAEAQFNLGLLLSGEKQWDEALVHLTKATALRANFVPAWFHLGRLHAEQGRLDEAVTCYRRALEIDPTHTRAYVELGKTLRQQGKPDEAMRYWRHGVKVATQPSVIAELLQQ